MDLSATVCSLNLLSSFRPTMRSLSKRANNDTCSTESHNVPVRLIESPVQHLSDLKHMQPFQKLPFPIFCHLWGNVLLRVQFLPWVHWQCFAASSGCHQSVCVVKWGVECLFKLVVSCSEAPSDRWHDSPDPWVGDLTYPQSHLKRAQLTPPHHGSSIWQPVAVFCSIYYAEHSGRPIHCL